MSSTPDGSELFGNGRTWFHLQQYVMGVLSRKFRWVQQENIEDAAAEAVLWAMTMWVKVPSSVHPDNQWLTYRGARWATSRKATELLLEEVGDRSVEMDSAPHDELVDRAGSVIEELQADEREWTTWARDFLNGESLRDTAKRQGISHVAVHKRRMSGMARIQPLLHRFGLAA